MDWTSPKFLIAAAAVVGVIVWGIPGLVVGAVGGFVLSLIISFSLNLFWGGVVPRKIRRDLVTNIIANSATEVRAAFPGTTGNALFHAVEQLVERLARKAISLSPTQEMVFNEAVMAHAAELLMQEESDPAKRELIGAIYEQLWTDWYSWHYKGQR